MLQQRGFDPLQHTRFSYHHYGPYSEQLAGALDQAVASGLVKEERRESAKGRTLYAYELNHEHPDAAYLALPSDEADAVRSFMSMSKDAHWRTLELAATVVYLERNLTIPRQAAMKRALGLKPDCQPFASSAEALLSRGLGRRSADSRSEDQRRARLFPSSIKQLDQTRKPVPQGGRAFECAKGGT